MYCSDCGIPRGIGKANEWRPNGVIASRYEKDLRGIFYDVSELEDLFASLSAKIGYDVTRLVVEGKRKDSAHYTRGLLSSIEKAGGSVEPEEFFRIMAANFSVPGFGKVKIISYRDGGDVELEVEGAYNVPMAQGQVAGVFEGVLKRRGDVVWEGDARRGRVTVTVRDEEQELEKRVESEVEHALHLCEEGDMEYELCPRCSAPRKLGREFDWDVEKAMITERRSGKRYIFDNTRGMAAVMKLLEDELGEDVELTLMEIARDYARGYYLGLGGRPDMQDEFDRLSLWGWGLPSHLKGSNGGLLLQVINPFHSSVMAGRVWGLAEASSGRDLDLDAYEHGDSVTEIALSET